MLAMLTTEEFFYMQDSSSRQRCAVGMVAGREEVSTPMRLTGLKQHSRGAAPDGKSAGLGPVGPDTPRKGPRICLLLGVETGQAGVTADNNHAPWSHLPDMAIAGVPLAGHEAGRPGTGAEVGRGPSRRLRRG
jgi:hypothetical protein